MFCIQHGFFSIINKNAILPDLYNYKNKEMWYMIHWLPMTQIDNAVADPDFFIRRVGH